MKYTCKLLLALLTLQIMVCSKRYEYQQFSRNSAFDALSKTFFYTNIYNSTIIVIRGDSISSIPVSWYPVALVSHSQGNKLYCVNTYVDSVTVIDAAERRVIAMLPTGPKPYSVVWNNLDDKVYCGHFDGLTVVDGKTDKVITTIKTDYWAKDCIWNSKINCIYAISPDTAVVIDCRSDTIIATIPMDEFIDEPTWSSRENKIYCANVIKKAIIIIDCTENKVISKVATSDVPFGLVYSQTLNRLYYLSREDSSIMGIDCRTDTIIDKIAIRGIPNALALNSAGDKLYCAEEKGITVVDCRKKRIVRMVDTDNRAYWNVMTVPRTDLIYALSHGLSRILRINTETDEIIDTIKIMPKPSVLLYSALHKTIYCASAFDTQIAAIDTKSKNVVSMIPAVRFPAVSIAGLSGEYYYHQFLVFDSSMKYLYCASPYDSTVAVIDLEKNKYLYNINTGTPVAAMVSNPTKNEIHCGGRQKPEICVIDAKLHSIKERIPVEGRAYFLALNERGNELYCACLNLNNGEYSIQVVDCNSNKMIAKIPRNAQQAYLFWNEVNNEIYAAEHFNEAISVIDCKTRKIVKLIDLGNKPSFPPRLRERFLTLDRKDKKIYCSNLGSDNISVIDAISNKFKRNIPVGNEPGGVLVWNQNNNRLYCANRESNTVSVIDCSSDVVVKTINVGHIPYSLAFDKEEDKIFCANYGSASVSVIDCSTDNVITTIPIP